MLIAPSAYRRHAARQRNPALCSLRTQSDARQLPQVQRVWQSNMEVYGADKVWRQLNREGVAVARCAVEQLRSQQGLQDARRGKAVRTTVSDPKCRARWTRSTGCFAPSGPISSGSRNQKVPDYVVVADRAALGPLQ